MEKEIVRKKAGKKICKDCEKLAREIKIIQIINLKLKNRLDLIKAQADLNFC